MEFLDDPNELGDGQYEEEFSMEFLENPNDLGGENEDLYVNENDPASPEELGR